MRAHYICSSKGHGAPVSPAGQNGVTVERHYTGELSNIIAREEQCSVGQIRKSGNGNAEAFTEMANPLDSCPGEPKKRCYCLHQPKQTAMPRTEGSEMEYTVGTAWQYGAAGVMVAHLFWEQEEQFKSGSFHHERRQRGDMTCN